MIKKSKAEKTILTVHFVFFMLYAITLIFPFVWLFINSLKTHQEFFQNVWALPQKAYFSNYAEAFSAKVGQHTFMDMLFNSVVLNVALTFVGVFSPTVVSYVVAKYKFKLNRMLFLLAIIVISVPNIGGTAAMFKLVNGLNLYNSYLSIILIGSGGFGFTFLLLYASFKSISWEYAEAGYMDGASDFRIFLQIMIPMNIHVITILSVLAFIGCWNDYFSVYMYAPAKPTLALGIKQFSDSLSSADASYPHLFAIMMISLAPVIIIFTTFQKSIMKISMGGGLKG